MFLERYKEFGYQNQPLENYKDELQFKQELDLIQNFKYMKEISDNKNDENFLTNEIQFKIEQQPKSNFQEEESNNFRLQHGFDKFEYTGPKNFGNK